MASLSRAQLQAIDEAYLEQQLLGDAKELGWMAHHIRDSRRVLMGDPGFPDWVLARDGRIVIAELKREAGELSGQQRRWIEALTGSALQAGPLPTSGLPIPSAVSVHIWTPTQWDDRTIKRTLT